MKVTNIRGTNFAGLAEQVTAAAEAKVPVGKPGGSKVTVKPPSTEHLKTQQPPTRGREQEGNLTVGRTTKPGDKGAPVA